MYSKIKFSLLTHLAWNLVCFSSPLFSTSSFSRRSPFGCTSRHIRSPFHLASSLDRLLIRRTCGFGFWRDSFPLSSSVQEGIRAGSRSSECCGHCFFRCRYHWFSHSCRTFSSSLPTSVGHDPPIPLSFQLCKTSRLWVLRLSDCEVFSCIPSS